MDPASASELRDFLSRSNSRMDHQDEQGTVSNRAIQALVSQVSMLTTQLQSLQTEPEQRSTAANSPAPTIPDQADRFIEPRLPPPAVYSQFQPASRPFDRLNLHQDSVQVVQRSGSCVYQTERLLCFSSHTHRP